MRAKERGAAHVLVLTHRGDEDVPERVAHAIEKRGATVARIDTDLFPRQAALALDLGDGERLLWIESAREHDLARAHALWCRRLWPANAGTTPSGVDDAFEAAARMQARDAFFGALALLGDRVQVIDDPHAVARAEHKPFQLSLARSARLSVPPTLITNDAASARAFVAAHERVVTKLLVPLSQTAHGEGPQMFTTWLDPHDLRALDDVQRAPQIFQVAIDKRLDVRVVVVGRRMFAAATDACRQLDWRRAAAGSLRWHDVRVPDDVARGARRLLRALSLRSGVFDFVVDAHGAWHFLEVNPAGEWGFLAATLGHPIAEAFAELLSP